MTLATSASAFLDLPWARIAYSFLLVALIMMLANEIRTVWSKKKVTLGEFTYFDDGTEDGGRSAALSLSIRHHMTILNGKFLAEHARAKEENDEDGSSERQVAQIPRGEFEPGKSSSLFGDLDVAVQGVNLSRLLTAIRTRVSPPDAVSGSVSRRDESASAAISWPSAPPPDSAIVNNKLMRFSGTLNDDELAERVACSLVWSHAVGSSGNEIIKLDHASFCTFANNWSSFVDIRSLVEAGEQLTDSHITLLRSIVSAMTSLIDRNLNYSELYRLRANAIDLLPDAEDILRALAITDRRVFERSLEDRPLSEIREEILAASIGTNAPSNVGFIRSRNSGQSFVGTAWVVADDVVAVPSFVALSQTPTGMPIRSVEGVEFSVASLVGDPTAQVFEADEVVALSSPSPGQSGQIALIRFPGLDRAGIEPLPLASTKTAVGDTGTLIAFQSNGLQTTQSMSVLGLEALTGRILHDANTSPGSAGAPILNKDGEVIGVHFGTTTTNDGMTTGVGVSVATFADLLR